MGGGGGGGGTGGMCQIVVCLLNTLTHFEQKSVPP